MTRTAFEKENDELLSFVLDNRFFEPWRRADVSPKSLWNSSSLELFITSDCNLKCEYCYLQKHGEELYPKEIRDKKTILSNMRLLFDWFLSEGFKLNNIDLFSGEIWHTDFGFEVLDILEEYFKKGVSFQTITIPTNCSFLLYDKATYKMQETIDRFSGLGVRIIISCSIEGKVLENVTRSFAGESAYPTRDDLFYDKVFTFCKRNTYLFHPMVSAQNVKDWIENLKWYYSMAKEYEFPMTCPVMMLEVRDGNWTDEDIAYLLEYYGFEIDEHLKRCSGDAARLARQLLGMEGDCVNSGYINYALPLAENHPGCSIPTTLSVRLGDLMIVPCHRTAYKPLNYGSFAVEDGKITGIISNNPQMAIRVLCTNQKLTHHGCDVCPYNAFCMRGCLGAQREYVNEPFMPIPSVCKMFKAKYDYLIKKYEDMGVVNAWRDIPKYNIYYPTVQKTLEGIETIKKGWGRNNG